MRRREIVLLWGQSTVLGVDDGTLRSLFDEKSCGFSQQVKGREAAGRLQIGQTNVKYCFECNALG